MQRKDIKSVLEKIRTGNYDSTEEELAKQWLHQLNAGKASGYSDDDLERVSDEMWAVIAQENQRTVKIRLWPRIAVAVAIATIVFGTGLFVYKQNQQQTIDQGDYVQDVAPGKQGATLTLANGKKIRLTDAANGELASQAGVSVQKLANGQLVYEVKPSNKTTTELGAINTLSTARGETYQLRLPDGSLVWLNSASSLTYAANLMQGGKRRVKLEGEGFFEVAKDKKHPFVVETGQQEVEVLGTQFNVNAYRDEMMVATTLVEGSVKVSTGSLHKVIKPGEQAIKSEGSIRVSEANIDNITDWKNGDFFLDRINFKQAMRKIARWYNVELIYDENVPETLESGGWISRSNNLSAVLRAIEKSGLVHFRIEGRKVYISK